MFLSTLHTLRGISPAIMWMEEAAFSKQEMFLNVIVPIMEVQLTALIMISTLVDMFNWMTKLMNAKDEKGEPICNVLQQTLVCDRCMESKKPQECTHKLHEIPPYKDQRKLSVVRCIMGEHHQLLLRESMGVIGENGDTIFPIKYLKKLKEKETFKWQTSSVQAPTTVYLGCDPNAGGKNETAMIAMVNHNGMKVVCLIFRENRGFFLSVV